MSDPIHLTYLDHGVEKWNEWRDESPNIKPDLSGAYLFSKNLGSVNFCGADLGKADLFAADLFWADLTGAYLGQANLSNAELGETDLSNANLTGADLSNANLTGANLNLANLTKANLTGANLTGANLTKANLSSAQALSANFTGATFTGAILADWNINSATQLEDVLCHYVYIRNHLDGRRPHNDIFAIGEFTKLFQKALETVDLIFLNGIEWAAFLTSFQKLQVEIEGAEIAIQSIEKKSDGVFIVRVSAPPNLNKKHIEKYLKNEYRQALAQINHKYQYHLKVKDEQIEAYRHQNTNLTEVMKIMASQEIQFQSIAITEHQYMSEVSKYDLRGSSIGNFADTVQAGAKLQTIQHNYSSEDSKSLPEVAAEIQQLLTQLAQSSPAMPEAARQGMVAEAILQKTKENPAFQKRLFSALEAGSTELIRVFTTNAYVSVPLALVKGWLKSAA
ncbi:MAG TPA: pentapeptide repeat-containing protein [Coleofasciculaceae cyanobacterium]